MQTKPIFLDNIHEYDLDIQDDTYTLYYSQGEQWNSLTKGEQAFQVIDDGNKLKITQDKKAVLDYSESALLYIILRIMHSDHKYEIGDKRIL